MLLSSANGWSTCKELWSEVVHVTKDLEWKKIDFNRNSSHRIPKDSNGVYLICARSPVKTMSAHTVIYIGQVNRFRLRARFLEHVNNPGEKLQQFKSCFFPNLDFWYARVNELTKIDEIENLLIAAFNPPCNRRRGPRANAIMARFGTTKLIGTGK